MNLGDGELGPTSLVGSTEIHKKCSNCSIVLEELGLCLLGERDGADAGASAFSSLSSLSPTKCWPVPTSCWLVRGAPWARMRTWASEELRDCMEEGCEMWRQDVVSWRSKWEGGLARLWGEVEEEDSRIAQRWEIVLEVCIPWERKEGRMRRNCKFIIYWLKDWTDNFAIKYNLHSLRSLKIEEWEK